MSTMPVLSPPPPPAPPSVSPGGRTGPSWWLAAAALIALAITAAYSNSLQNGFHLDDLYGITPNKYVRSLEYIPQYFVDANTLNTHRDNVAYRPMVEVTYAINYAVSEAFGGKDHGYDPWSWHVMNLLLHGAVCLSIFGLGRALLGTGRIAPAKWISERDGDLASLCAAVLFAVHPVTAGCANYMWARSSLLSAAFILPATVLYIRAVQHGGVWRAALAALLYTAAQWTKEEAIAFLAIAVLIELLLARERKGMVLLGRFVPRRTILRLLPFFVIAPIYLYIRGRMLPPGQSAHWAASDMTRWQYLMTQTGAWWYYVGQLLSPLNLIADYGGYPHAMPLIDPPKDPNAGQFFSQLSIAFQPAVMLATSGWLLTGLLLLLAVRRAPQLVLLGAAFFIHLSPTSSIVPLAEMVNEHRPYLPHTGLFILGAVGLVLAVRRLADPQLTWTILTTLVLAVPLIFITRQRNTVFYDEGTYWRDIVEKDPTSGRAQLNYGMELWNKGNLDEAERHMREAVRLWNHWYFGYVDLGLLLAQRGDLTSARWYLDQACEYGRDSSIPFYHRGEFRLSHGDALAAAVDLLKASQLASFPGKELDALARAVKKLLEESQAVEACRYVEQGAAISKAPFADVAQPLMQRGVELMARMQLDEAEKCFTLAADVRAGFALPFVNLGILRDFQKRPAEARAYFDKAVAADPKDASAYRWRGQFIDKSGDVNGALPDLRKASELSGLAADLLTLADALTRAGQADEAAKVRARLPAR